MSQHGLGHREIVQDVSNTYVREFQYITSLHYDKPINCLGIKMQLSKVSIVFRLLLIKFYFVWIDSADNSHFKWFQFLGLFHVNLPEISSLNSQNKEIVHTVNVLKF